MTLVPSWLAAQLARWWGSRQAGGSSAATAGPSPAEGLRPAGGEKGRAGEQERAEQEGRLNRMLRTYPANQAFSLRRGSLVPGKKLAKRLRLLLPLYPAGVDSLLDIGCAQGFFVFDAARRHPGARVVGIDGSDAYGELWREVSSFLHLPQVHFYRGLLHEFVQKAGDFGGPFQIVLLVNTYHYLYFGSDLQSFGYRDHGRIFQMLATVCSDRLLWSSPLENRDCPRYSERGESGAEYTRDRILGAAQQFFTVEAAGSLGRRPLYLMRPRPALG